jgi:hypothetical protein
VNCTPSGSDWAGAVASRYIVLSGRLIHGMIQYEHRQAEKEKAVVRINRVRCSRFDDDPIELSRRLALHLRFSSWM